tara:strand:- start:30 stop:317 length:288 start_codon:yes stop_codon:yes gene_type:complete
MNSEVELCYKSTTFCDGNGGRCLKFKTCPLALTDEVQLKAKRWWAATGNSIDDDVPLAIVAAPRKLDCYEPPIKVSPVASPPAEAEEDPPEDTTL